MPSSAVRTFSDVDDYAGAIRAATVELAVMRPGAFNATLTRIDLPRLWMQRFSDNLPRVLDAANIVSGRTYISFCTQPGPRLIQDGVELHPSAIIRHGQADQYYQRSAGIAA